MHNVFGRNVRPYPEQAEAVDVAAKYHRGILSMVTGFGKSITMALLIYRLQVRTLVVVPNLELKRQLTETFRSIFGTNKNIVIENIDSPKLKTLTDFDCLLIDESHHVAAKTYRKLNKTAWKGTYYRYFFTATPFRSRDEEQLLFESVAGQVIYSVSYKDAVAKGYITPIEAYYYELPKIPVRGYTWAEVYKELVVDRADRNDLIAELMFKLEEEKKSTLCLVKEINHGDELKRLTGIEFANGQDETSKEYIREFSLGALGSLIGTVGVVGEGVDTKPAEYVIVAGLGKSRPAFMQQCGRGVRMFKDKESCKIILFKDASHKWTLAHFNAQCKILRDEYGVKAVKL